MISPEPNKDLSLIGAQYILVELYPKKSLHKVQRGGWYAIGTLYKEKIFFKMFANICTYIQVKIKFHINS